MRKRLISLLLCLLLLAGLATAGRADGGSWICPSCGQEGNTGNFCSNCAAARPSETWTCPSCGQEGNKGNFCPNCAAARPDGTSESTKPAENAGKVTVNEQLEQIPGQTDRVKVRVSSVSATRYIENAEEPTRWVPENAADGDESTCWQFSSAGKKTLSKSWMDLTLASPQTVDELWFKNGFWGYSTTGKDQYPLNARPKGVRIAFLYQGAADYGDQVGLTLADDKLRTDWQKFDVGHHENVVGVRVYVVTYYPGSQFKNDVCLSEVMLVQKASASIAAEASATNPPTTYEAPKTPSAANLLDRLSTRAGPGTEYEEPGTFFPKNWKEQTVKVTGKAYDGSIWWVEVDFTNRNQSYRVWTGVKRVDVDLSKVKEIRPIGKASVGPTDAWWGPGGKYAKSKYDILFMEDNIDLYARENGYVQIDFYDVNREFQRRVWVPEAALSNVWWY